MSSKIEHLSSPLGGASHNRADLLQIAADMYYKQRLPLSRIAGELKVSVSYVSRLLSEAQKRGIVRFYVNSAGASIAEEDKMLGKELANRFQLERALVADISQNDHAKNDSDCLHEILGMQLAQKLYDSFWSGLNIGIGGGRGVLYTTRWIKILARTEGIVTSQALTITSLCGAMYRAVRDGNHRDRCVPIDADFNAAELGKVFNRANLRLINGPATLEDRTTLMPQWLSKASWSDASSRNAPDIAIYGISPFDEKHRFFTGMSESSPALAPIEGKVRELIKALSECQGLNTQTRWIVGEVCHNLLLLSPTEGSVLLSSKRTLQKLKDNIDAINSLLLGVELEQLSKVSRRILVAGGEQKLDIIWTLLTREQPETNWARPTELCTDSETAEWLLARKYAES